MNIHIKTAGLCLLVSLVMFSAHAADAPKKDAANATPRMSDGHPDLSGNWVGRTGSAGPPQAPKQVDANGSITMRMGGRPPGAGGPGGPPGTSGAGGPPPGFGPPGQMDAKVPRGSLGSGERFPGSRDNQPAYLSKEMQDKADRLFDQGYDEDKVVTCGLPGLPRVGAPEKIVQTPKELVFLYADNSSMVWRVIPTDGRNFRERYDPTYYGDSVGHWEGDTLVVESRNFIDDTWFGEYGYFHTDQMRVIERLTREGNTLTWQATVIDPGVLSKPWVKAPVKMTYIDKQIGEPFPCSVSPHDGGHHVQRIP